MIATEDLTVEGAEETAAMAVTPIQEDPTAVTGPTVPKGHIPASRRKRKTVGQSYFLAACLSGTNFNLAIAGGESFFSPSREILGQ